MFLFVFLFWYGVGSVVGLSIVEVDSLFLNYMFDDIGSYKVVKNGYSSEMINKRFNDEFEISIPAFINEECALECWRYLFCIRYSFQKSDNICKIRLSTIKRKYEFDDSTETTFLSMSIDLQRCSNGMYCLESLNKDIKISQTICDPLNLNDSRCNLPPIYEFSEWTKWGNCSEDGFMTRTRQCLKIVFDSVVKKNYTERVLNSEWLCRTSNISNESTEEVETCKIGTYTTWSTWSVCNRNCDGLRSRKRDCLLQSNNQFCSKQYLIESEPCGLPNCRNGLLKLDNPTAQKNLIPSSGLLTLQISDNQYFKLITFRPENLQKIASVACRQLKFNDFNRVSAKTSNELKQIYRRNTQNKTFSEFLNERSWNGIECNGSESNIKDCHITSNANIDMILYEVQIECLLNGYWSEWTSSVECSVTCGMGTTHRTRVCNNPPPTVTEIKNGTNCQGNPNSSTECVMPRCQKLPIP